MNWALLAKLGFRMLKAPTTLWAQVLWRKYGDPLAAVQKRGKVSHVWHGTVAGSNVLKEGLDRGPVAGNDGAICLKLTTNGAFQ